MTLEQNQFGTFFLKGPYRTPAATAGGIDGFPLWTEEEYEKRQEAKKKVAKKK